MSRKGNHSFVYTHLMRWEPYQVEGATGVAYIKTLSLDKETGARTALIKYDAGFRLPKSKSSWPVDSLVLEGSMRVGNRTYQKSTFHYRPLGHEAGPIETDTGCTRIIFTADKKEGSSKKEHYIQSVDAMPWQTGYSDPDLVKTGVKILREDPEANYSILINGMHASFHALDNEAFVHDHLEEVFLLEGEMEDYLGDIDGHIRWVPWVYICREPFQSLHGDTMRHHTPLQNLIRRGWVGKDLNARRKSEATKWSDVPKPGFQEYA